ncbi:transmembrane and immunoglobulin domain-containing protein 1-like isoform X1 [Acipenser ruthenus]|uniref:transmembrane and immunoglobulin domain-containing protein 1-like isoform X1 n=2 Tax=Acipenser ruthenus TaxID=7906 RepID=UPI0027410C5C|nr:transmembrane and immunoglobulin domain-containing protein 1-like isoform X1 [Acipenser ruthenus]
MSCTVLCSVLLMPFPCFYSAARLLLFTMRMAVKVLPCLLLLTLCSQLKGAAVTVGIWNRGALVEQKGWITVNRSEAVTLDCRVEGAEKEEELVWYRERMRVNLPPHNKLNYSSICINPISDTDHLVTFACHLKRDELVNASVQLNVQFPPLLAGSEEVRVEKGNEVTLTCDVYSNPRPAVSWSKNSSSLDIGLHCQLIQDGREARLHITKAQPYHQGEYKCEASSSHGSYSKTFQLHVDGKSSRVPFEPIVAAVVVAVLTLGMAFISRIRRIAKCCKKGELPPTGQ